MPNKIKNGTSNLEVAIRCHLDHKTGTGHFTRMITLATSLLKNEISTVFYCSGDLNTIDKISAKRFKITYLSDSPLNKETDKSIESLLSETEEKSDALHFLNSLKNTPTWVIVDNYRLGQVWENTVKTELNCLLGVIDDLSNRYHFCDLLVDMTYGKTTDDYQDWVSNKTKLLIGSQYALVQVAFQEKKWAVTNSLDPITILITFGGTDPNGFTLTTLDLLTQHFPEISINIVIRENTHQQQEIFSRVKYLKKATLYQDISSDKMAELMACSTLAIASCGTTTWERCAIGLPTIAIIIAENQRHIAENLAKDKVHLLSDTDRLLHDLGQLLNHPNQLIDFSEKSKRICDGSGAERIINTMKTFMEPA